MTYSTKDKPLAVMCERVDAKLLDIACGTDTLIFDNLGTEMNKTR